MEHAGCQDLPTEDAFSSFQIAHTALKTRAIEIVWAAVKRRVIWRWDGRWKRDEGERPGFKKRAIRRKKDGNGKEEEEEPAMRGQLLPGKGFLRSEHIFGTWKRESESTHAHMLALPLRALAI